MRHVAGRTSRPAAVRAGEDQDVDDIWTGRHVLFTGDSVTDCGRRDDPDGLGAGYVRLLAEGPLSGARVTNTGAGGDRLPDLAARWRRDVLDQAPDVLSVLIGINDTWRRDDSGLISDDADFERIYRTLLRTLAGRDTLVVLVEPFVLPVTAGQRAWLDDLAPKAEIVQKLAAEFDAVHVPTADRLREASGLPQFLATDGVHPTPAGHEVLARLWADAVAPHLE